MRSFLLLSILLFNLGLYSQGNITVTVDSSGSPLEGVAVFFYNSAEDYPRCHSCWTTWSRLPNDFAEVQYTNAQGQVTFSLANVAANDSVYWATRDCNGVIGMNSKFYTGTGSLNESLTLPCRPSDCSVEGRVVDDPQSGMLIYEAYAYLSASAANLPSSAVNWAYEYIDANNNVLSIPGNNLSNDFDTIKIPRKPVEFIRVSRDNFQCVPPLSGYSNFDSVLVGDLGSWSPNGAPFCNALFTPSNSGSGASAGSLSLLEQSTVSRGAITQYVWNFGSFNSTYGSRLPTHTYPSGAETYRVFLTITAIDGNDTSYSQHSDLITFDAAGNGSFKNQNSFTVTVVDGGVALSELSAADFSLYPNPAKNIATLTWSEGVSVDKVWVQRIDGSLVQEIQNPTQHLELNSLENGTYLVKIHSDKSSTTLKLIVQ